MKGNIYLYILVMAAVSYGIRVLPITLIRKPIESTFIKSFLYYVPYVTLSVMTFPAITDATQCSLSGQLALIGGVVTAWLKGSLFTVAVVCCLIVFVSELILV